MKRPLCLVLCKESPCNLIITLGPFQIFATMNFYNIELTDTSGAGRTVKKVENILQFFAF